MPQLVLSAQAPGADIDAFRLPPYNYHRATDIRQPRPPSMLLRMTDIIAKLNCLPTKVTFCHSYLDKAYYYRKIPLQ